MKLLLPILGIIIIVVAVFWIFSTNQLYVYGTSQGMNNSSNSQSFNLWQTLATLPTFVYYGAAMICIVAGIIKMF